MNRLSIALLCVALSSCAVESGLDQPEPWIEPQFYLYELTGKTKLQSTSATGVADNPSIRVQDFGMTARDSDLGFVAGLGDGFSGFEFGFQKIEIGSTNQGTLTANWGALQQGMKATSQFDENEYRLSYIAQLFLYEPEEDDWRIRLGLGASIVHRDGEFSGQEVQTSVTQTIHFRDDGVPYLAARLRGEYAGAALTLDYAINPDVTFGGDFTGVMQDIGLMGSYTPEAQRFSLRAGYRWSLQNMSGADGGLAYEDEFTVEGWVFGVRVTF